MSVEFVGIELDLRGEEEVFDDLQKIDRLLNTLRGRKKVDAGMNDLRKQIVAARGELEKFQRLQKDAGGKGKSAWVEANLDKARYKLKDLQQAQREFQASTKAMGETFRQTFNRYSSMLTHAGSKMQSLGNALTKLTSPFERFTTGMLMGAGYKALGKFTEGLENGFTRYDTMKKYPKIMASFGYSAKESQESIDALDRSVRGLPTGLDEMVDMTQRFTATTGNLTKGTKLAIATNNAFLASMSTDTQKYQGMMQLQDVLGGKDMNAREWNSLVSSMTPAIVKMGESLGYTSKNMGEFIQKVRDGKMSNEDFIDQLIKIGQEGGVLASMANESKDTWQAFFANVGNAASRMTAGIIQSMDEIVKSLGLKDKDGNAIESVNRLLSDRLIPTIDKATASAKEWINAHPEEIKEFFTDLSKIDIKGFLKGMAEGMRDLAGWTQKLANALGDRGLEWLGKFMIKGNILGRGLTIFGGVLKGLSHPLALIATLISRMGGGKLAGGLFGKLKGLFGSKKNMQEVADTATIAKGALNRLVGLAEAAGAVLIVGGTGFATFKFVKSMIKDLEEIITVADGIDWNKGVASLTAMVAGIGFATEAFQAIGTMIGKGGLLSVAIAGLASVIVTGSFAADMYLIKTGFKNFQETIDTVNDVIASVNNFKTVGDIDGVVAKAEKAVEMLNRLKDAFTGKSGEKKDRGQITQGIPTFSKFKADSVKNISDAISNIENIVKQLNKINNLQLETSNVGTLMEELRVQLNSVRNAVAFHNVGNIQVDSEKLANAMIQVRRVIYHLNKIGSLKVSTSGGANIKKAINSIKEAFTDSSVGALASQIQAFATSIKNALAEIRALDGEVEVNVTFRLSKGFYSTKASVIKAIKKAKNDIRAQRTAVSFTIPVNVRFSVSTNLGSALAKIRSAGSTLASAGRGQRPITVHQATGGMIYRAKGGDVPKRRGTDTVHAMLTPGEYVQNKKAVSLFGIDFMRKVNNLDMKGAMTELMHRAGNMANVGRQTIINNYYNNNQKVTQNINNPSPGFAFKSASRFAGAF